MGLEVAMSLRNLATLISVLLGGLSAHALDSSNPVVVSGSASFQQNGSNWNITTNSNKTIINWQNFGVPYGSTTKFNQPGVNPATLNRVTGSLPSRIDGNLLSNGRVYLINQHGVICGKWKGSPGEEELDAAIEKLMNIAEAERNRAGK